MRCLFLALFLVSLGPADSVSTAVHRLEQHYNHAQTLKATFFEAYADGSGGMMAESGTVYFSRPGRMRWEYESPENELFLVDPPNVWFYVPADRTASRAKLKQSSDWRTPLALLVGNTNLSKLCRNIQMAGVSTITKGDLSPPVPGDTILECTPRDAQPGEANTVLLETDPDGQLVRVVINEPGNARTEFRFGNWEENIPIPELKFHFQPPAGVAIVDDQALPGELR